MTFSENNAKLPENMFSKLKTFVQESRQEFKRVNWPSREETIKYTTFVIVLSLALSAFLGVLDFGFVQAIKNLVLKI